MTWRHFQISEFSCRHCGLNLMDHAFIDLLDELRERLGFPLPVSSGYRCPAHNRAVSTTGDTGPHTTGKAADLLVSHSRAYDVLCTAPLLGFTGIGLQQKSSTRFIHLDTLPNAPGQPRPTVWSY